MTFFFFQAEDGIRDLVRSRGLGDVYKRQEQNVAAVSQITVTADYLDGIVDRLHKAVRQYRYLSLIHI